MREIILVELCPRIPGFEVVGPFWTPILVEGPPGARKVIYATHFASMESESAMEWGMELWEHLLEDVA